MILKGDILKNSLRQKGVAALEKLPSPSVRCHFDDGQDYYGKNSSAPLFSWHVKGDFRLPLSLKREIWKEYEIVEKERTLEETKSLLEEKLRKKTENLLSPYGKIENIEIRFEEYADSVRAEAEATLLDRIDEKRPTESEERERENLNEF